MPAKDISSITCFVFVSGCATAVKVNTGEFRQNKKVLIYHELDHKLNITPVGVTAFTNNRFSVNLDGWDT